MTDPSEKPDVIRNAEAFIKKEAQQGLGVTFLYGVFTTILIFGVASEMMPFILFAMAMGGSTAGWLGYVLWSQSANAEKMTEAKSLVSTYNDKLASLLIAQDTSPKKHIDFNTDDERWEGTRSLLERVQKMAGEDAAIRSVVDDIAEYLIGAFQALQSLEHGLKAEQDLNQDTPECDARQARILGKLTQRNQQVDALISALRDVHVELTMREDGNHEGLSEQLRDVFFRVQAENEVREETRLPREDIATDSDARRPPQKETT